MKEFNVTGPPGCGKTTYLSKNVNNAADSYGGAKVVVCSLTRAAASHVAGAGVKIPRECVGTIHSLAYRALPGVEVAEVKADEFDTYCGENRQPSMKLGAASKRKLDDLDGEDIVESPMNGDAPGLKLQGEMNRFRARMIPRASWPESVRAFANLWDRWKKDAGFLDFTDLLEISLRDVSECPMKPAAIFGDESQDFSKLAFSLLRKWGERCLRFIHVGDRDQVLYQWCGVDVSSFDSAGLPESQKRLLHQSYRIPRAVHSLAVKWIDETPNRAKIEYEPRRIDPRDPTSAFVEGVVSRSPATTQAPGAAVADAKRRVSDGKTVLFLASCSYMLTRLIATLRDSGLPYHNPYRVIRGDWNPLRNGANSPSARLAAFVKPNAEYNPSPLHWTWQDIGRWVEWLPSKDYLQYGAKTTIAENAKERPGETAEIHELFQLFDPGWLNQVIDSDLDWWKNAVEKKQRPKLDYPIKVLNTHGYPALIETPKIIVSTIHAAKGGESDIVYLWPDLSPQAHTDWLGRGDGKEGVRRTYYVAMTRAREELVLCAPCNNMSVRL